ncbi:acyltransferase family protein [Pseudomonas gozinkensis]|uniref:acyltransferase family protein n=1 Tax=Pseudomonas gozinkensis TaxID=2774461 RepID=UPI001787BC42|nr:acyltransferase [Pseudomonas gozinkensis]
MSGRFEGADGIRGLACLIVICIHASAYFFPSTGTLLAGTGKIGVWLFFVLSAFLLTSKFMKSGFGLKSTISYAVGRILRILPLFYLVVLIYYSKGWIGLETRFDIVRAITFESGYGHLWTIPAEFKFYFILPLFAYLVIEIYNRFGLYLATLGCALLVVAQQSIWPYWLTPENSVETRWYLSSFTFGIVCAIIHHSFRDKLDDQKADIIGLSIIVIIVMTFPYFRNIIFGMPIDKWLMNKYLLFSPLWMLFILVLADGKGRLGGLLKNIVFRKIGEWSYSIYLIHIMIYALVTQGRPTSFLLMVVGIIGSVLAGAVLFYCFEGPMENLRHKIQSRIFRT